ncbi:MAG: tRNA 2-selenouridine(34) synthase MnmH [Aquincola sp.]|nr:tRNA 2-selenouridine(34) synthase MnmH [Aquincola sp.]MDH5330771.1 tRNA 2-selenouridine(34) synthase MnmH [Aquincola sp.]
MSVVTLPAPEAAARLASFDAIIDARSPAEFAEDRLPGAVNWPVLDDDERHAVGFDYKQVSSFDARKRGAAMVARRIAEHIETRAIDKPRDWKPLVYCWRGGQRSGTLAWFLAQIGFRTHVLQGGYKAFRVVVREQLAVLPERFDFTVIAGRTGSGKTRLLRALAAEGAQVLDLEGLARHRGSVLGGLPDEGQPSQKAFETSVWHALQGFDAKRSVFVESESRKIGTIAVPDALLARMRAHGRVLMVSMPDESRVRLLLEEYGFFAGQVERFCAHMDTLAELRGKETVARWKDLAREGRWPEVFADLMHRHYDPLYMRSIQRNFAGVAAAREVVLRDGDPATLRAAAADAHRAS